MKKRLLSLALGTMMVLSTLAGCGSKDGGSAAVNTKPEEQGKVLNIYCWNEEFKSRFEGYYKNVPSDVKVNWVITPNENNAYQNALDAALLKQKDAAADDKIDMFLIEALRPRGTPRRRAGRLVGAPAVTRGPGRNQSNGKEVLADGSGTACGENP